MSKPSEYGIAVLAYISSCRGGVAPAKEVAARFEHARINDLQRNGLIEPADYSDEPGRLFHASAWRLTVTGKDTLKAHQDAIEQERRAKAEKDREKAADDAKAALKEKKSFRNNLKVAAFTVVLTLFFEHLSEIIQFVNRLLQTVRAFFAE